MHSRRLALTLSALNLVLLAFITAVHSPLGAKEPPGLLRGRALELVDEHGHVRAEIKVLPADPKARMPDGKTGYPETVLLRLLTSDGNPNVKLSTTEDGAGLVIGGSNGFVQLISREKQPVLRVHAKNGRERVVEP
ncbi:MAG TPA: hypothetical protein VJT85_00315 [Gemmatimonadaceae bacterium]|nr:hypothetical protein [Gemmatimonadaceae bacterium]